MEKLLGIVAAAAGVAETEAAELATTDEGIATLGSKVTAKLADVKKNADGRALKIARDAFKAAGVDASVFEEGREFKENVAAAVADLQTKVVADSGKGVTDEQALKHPAVIKLKNDLTLETERKVTAAKQEAADALKADKDAFEAQKTEGEVRAWAKAQIKELKPNFSTDPRIAAAQEKDLEDKIVAAGKYQKQGDALLLVDAAGEILKDAMQNPLKPETVVRTLAETFYGLPTSQPRDTPHLTPEQAAAAAAKLPYTGPKTRAEYDAKVLTLNSREERQALKETFDAYEKETTTAA